MRHAMYAAGAALVLLSGCAADGGSPAVRAGSGQPGGGATATLADAAGAPRGVARIVQQGGVLRLTYEAAGLPPGVHGIHVHAVGRCDGPDFQTAGGHWNPTTTKHGSENPQGPHRGDMPNLAVRADGTARYDATLPGGTLSGEGGLLDADGASIVVHAAADDYRTDPAGNSGARTACGILQAG